MIDLRAAAGRGGALDVLVDRVDEVRDVVHAGPTVVRGEMVVVRRRAIACGLDQLDPDVARIVERDVGRIRDRVSAILDVETVSGKCR